MVRLEQQPSQNNMPKIFVPVKKRYVLEITAQPNKHKLFISELFGIIVAFRFRKDILKVEVVKV